MTGPIRFSLADHPPEGAFIDPVTGTFSWTPIARDAGKTFRIPIRVGYVAPPSLFETVVLRIYVKGPVTLEPPRVDAEHGQTLIAAHVPEDLTYCLEYTDDIDSAFPTWINLGPIYGDFIDATWPLPPQRIYRVVYNK